MWYLLFPLLALAVVVGMWRRAQTQASVDWYAAGRKAVARQREQDERSFAEYARVTAKHDLPDYVPEDIMERRYWQLPVNSWTDPDEDERVGR